MESFRYPDNRVIAQHAGLLVLAPRHEIMFRDGSTVHLHALSRVGQPTVVDLMLRAVHVDGMRWLVLDLRKFSAEIEGDLCRAEQRDRFGMVWFTLRGQFGTASAFLDAAHQLCNAAWWPECQQAAA